MNLLVSTEDVSVFGGPASINVNVGTGAQGIRGTYIFTGIGNPNTLDANDFLDNATQFIKTVQAKDLYINLNPSDPEYLYLYQYDQSANGTYQWKKTLRLIPNTAIANAPVLFYNGNAVTFIAASPEAQTAFESIDISTIIPSPTAPGTPTAGTLWLDLSTNPPTLKAYSGSAWVIQGTVLTGQFLPLASYFDMEQLGTVDPATFNIQYSILNDNGKPISSSISVGEVVTSNSTLPIYVNAIEATTNPSTGDITWAPITGLKVVHLLVTAGVGA